MKKTTNFSINKKRRSTSNYPFQKNPKKDLLESGQKSIGSRIAILFLCFLFPFLVNAQTCTEICNMTAAEITAAHLGVSCVDCSKFVSPCVTCPPITCDDICKFKEENPTLTDAQIISTLTTIGIPIPAGCILADCGVDNCPTDPNKTEPGQCGCGIADMDNDNDGIANCNDGCPDDPNKANPETCGCGIPDTDSDNDGTPNCNDNCDNDPNKINPGICGCGIPETPVCGTAVDNCPNDPNKTESGQCGCDIPDTDSDNDGTPDCKDGCPNDSNKTSPGACDCGQPEVAGCGSTEVGDKCPDNPNKTEPGICGCDVEDIDTDGDGTEDCIDVCPTDKRFSTTILIGCDCNDPDTDGDGTSDCNDKCPMDPNKIEPGKCDCGTPDIVNIEIQVVGMEGEDTVDPLDDKKIVNIKVNMESAPTQSGLQVKQGDKEVVNNHNIPNGNESNQIVIPNVTLNSDGSNKSISVKWKDNAFDCGMTVSNLEELESHSVEGCTKVSNLTFLDCPGIPNCYRMSWKGQSGDNFQFKLEKTGGSGADLSKEGLTEDTQMDIFLNPNTQYKFTVIAVCPDNSLQPSIACTIIIDALRSGLPPVNPPDKPDCSIDAVIKHIDSFCDSDKGEFFVTYLLNVTGSGSSYTITPKPDSESGERVIGVTKVIQYDGEDEDNLPSQITVTDIDNPKCFKTIALPKIDCDLECNIEIFISNIKNCNDNGGPNQGKLDFEADITTVFSPIIPGAEVSLSFGVITESGSVESGLMRAEQIVQSGNNKQEFKGLKFQSDGKPKEIIVHATVKFDGVFVCFSEKRFPLNSPNLCKKHPKPKIKKVEPKANTAEVEIEKTEGSIGTQATVIPTGTGITQTFFTSSTSFDFDNLFPNTEHIAYFEALFPGQETSDLVEVPFRTTEPVPVAAGPCLIAAQVSGEACDEETNTVKFDLLVTGLGISDNYIASFGGSGLGTKPYFINTTFQTGARGGDGDLLINIVDSKDKDCKTTATVKDLGRCADCAITNIRFGKLKKKFDRGSPNNIRFHFIEAEMEVDFVNPPPGGVLTLEVLDGGFASRSQAVGTLGGGAAAIFTLRLPADGKPFTIKASFSNEPDCMRTEEFPGFTLKEICKDGCLFILETSNVFCFTLDNGDINVQLNLQVSGLGTENLLLGRSSPGNSTIEIFQDLFSDEGELQTALDINANIPGFVVREGEQIFIVAEGKCFREINIDDLCAGFFFQFPDCSGSVRRTSGIGQAAAIFFRLSKPNKRRNDHRPAF